MKYILASKSPRRKQLLHRLLKKFIVESADIDESYPSNIKFSQIPISIAQKKAITIQKKHEQDCCIIAADTIVVLNNQVLGKPQSHNEAVQMLKMLSNQTHRVITGVCILKGKTKKCFSCTTSVTFYDLSEEEIKNYVATNSPFDKAGGYGIQDRGALFIKKINGDFYNVMGLPIAKLSRILKQLK